MQTKGNRLEDKEMTKITIRCFCGRKVVLGVVGGQYQDTYCGECRCGRKWQLEEWSEALKEIEDC